jgi:hypothetical protein
MRREEQQRNQREAREKREAEGRDRAKK